MRKVGRKFGTVGIKGKVSRGDTKAHESECTQYSLYRKGALVTFLFSKNCDPAFSSYGIDSCL